MSNGIRRTSGGLFVSTPTTPPVPQRKMCSVEDEIIPDSEEECLNKARNDTGQNSDAQILPPIKAPRIFEPSVIEISSGSENEEREVRHRRLITNSENPFLAKSTSYKDALHRRNKGKGKALCATPHVENDSDSSVICISDSGSDISPPKAPISPVKQRILQRTLTPYAPITASTDPDNYSDDSAILTFEPPAHTKPVLRTPGAKSKPKSSSSTKTSARGVASPPVTPRRHKTVPQGQLRLEAYARTLFDELNTTIFGGAMPPTTELVWNVRLATTAGRAFWSRNRHGESLSKIELSPKVIDNDERVRYTLAHEMCHLAVWVLDDNPNEQGHGRQFKAWAARVMQARPDIIISTKHTYEINYKYYWECCACGWKYGRHSKSIDPNKMSCGVCKPPGRLKPLFETGPPRTPKITSKSKLASGSPRQSPRTVDRESREPTKLNPPTSVDDGVEGLNMGLKNIGI